MMMMMMMMMMMVMMMMMMVNDDDDSRILGLARVRRVFATCTVCLYMSGELKWLPCKRVLAGP